MSRAALAAALAAALLTGSPASAAPVCRLVTDPAGDHMVLAPQTTAALTTDVDVLSADVAIDRSHVVAAIRLASLRRFDPRSPEPKQYLMSFTIDGAEWSMLAYVTSTGVDGEVSGPSYVYFPATVALDHVRREVRIAAPVKHFGKPYRGSVVADVTATAGPYAGMTGADGTAGPVSYNFGGAIGLAWPADTATGTRTYRGGTPTCVLMPA